MQWAAVKIWLVEIMDPPQHFVRTIDDNSGVSRNAARTNAIKSLIIQTCMETFVQLYSFATNSALR